MHLHMPGASKDSIVAVWEYERLVQSSEISKGASSIWLQGAVRDELGKAKKLRIVMDHQPLSA